MATMQGFMAAALLLFLLASPAALAVRSSISAISTTSQGNGITPPASPVYFTDGYVFNWGNYGVSYPSEANVCCNARIQIQWVDQGTEHDLLMSPSGACGQTANVASGVVAEGAVNTTGVAVLTFTEDGDYYIIDSNSTLCNAGQHIMISVRDCATNSTTYPPTSNTTFQCIGTSPVTTTVPVMNTTTTATPQTNTSVSTNVSTDNSTGNTTAPNGAAANRITAFVIAVSMVATLLSMAML